MNSQDHILDNMFPCEPALNGAYDPVPNLEPTSHFADPETLCETTADGANFVIGKYGDVVVFTLLAAVPASVLAVLFLGAPAQIIEPVISGVAVSMTTLLPWRGRTNKSVQHKTMNKNVLFLSVFMQANPACAPRTTLHWKRFERATFYVHGARTVTAASNYSIKRTNLSIVRHFVQTFVTFNRNPTHHG